MADPSMFRSSRGCLANLPILRLGQPAVDLEARCSQKSDHSFVLFVVLLTQCLVQTVLGVRRGLLNRHPHRSTAFATVGGRQVRKLIPQGTAESLLSIDWSLGLNNKVILRSEK